MLNLSDVVEAKYRIRDYVHDTPLMISETLSQATGAEVYVKLESLQKTGAFKVRGIYNKILSTPLCDRQLGFITASSGNHGLGLAYVCRELGLRSTIVVPTYTPKLKTDSIQREGANLLLYGNNWNESYKHAESLAAETGQTLIHPFDDDLIIAGQGTIALEILEKLKSPADYFLASIGGGSMIASNSLVFKHLSPGTKIIGLQTFGADAMFQSLKNDKLVELSEITSKVESFATRSVTQRTFEPVKKYVDEIIRISDSDCIEAALFMLERSNILLELSASICVSALFNENFHYTTGSKIVLVLCGGNFDLEKLAIEIAKRKTPETASDIA